jgi:hypothetical protein
VGVSVLDAVGEQGSDRLTDAVMDGLRVGDAD